MTHKIDLTELQQQVVKVATERPDFVYIDQENASRTNCSYVGAKKGVVGGEGCIVGQALMRMGIPEQELRDWENSQQGTGTPVSALLRDPEVFEYTGNILQIEQLRDVQRNQDMGNPWGLAVAPLPVLV